MDGRTVQRKGCAMTGKLDRRRALFCREYLIDLNATQAAIRVGYKPSNAATYGLRMLAREDVQKEIARLQQERAERVQIRADDVLREVASIALADVPAPATTSEKLKALDMLMRHLGLYEPDRAQRGREGMVALADAILGNVASAGGLSVE